MLLKKIELELVPGSMEKIEDYENDVKFHFLELYTNRLRWVGKFRKLERQESTDVWKEAFVSFDFTGNKDSIVTVDLGMNHEQKMFVLYIDFPTEKVTILFRKSVHAEALKKQIIEWRWGIGTIV